MENKIAIYKIVNSNGIVEYIGQTCDIQRRFYDHVKHKPGYGNGLFYKRTDVTLEVIEYADTRKKAIKIEEYWQTYYGFTTEHKKVWDTINMDPEKKRKLYEKRCITFKNKKQLCIA